MRNAGKAYIVTAFACAVSIALVAAAKTRPKVLITKAAAITAASITIAPDWDSCADELDQLKREASDGTDKANDVKSKVEDLKTKEDEAESRKREYDRCKAEPGFYDTFKDGCSSQISRYSSALSDVRSADSDLKSAIGDLQDQLDTVGNKVRQVASSCSYDFGSKSPSSGADLSRYDRVCRVYTRYKDELPKEMLMSECKKQMTDDECKKCLGTK